MAGEQEFLKVLLQIHQRQGQENSRYAAQVQTLQKRLAAANQRIAEFQQQLQCKHFDFASSPMENSTVNAVHAGIVNNDYEPYARSNSDEPNGIAGENGKAGTSNVDTVDDNCEDTLSTVSIEEVDFDYGAADSDTLHNEASDEGHASTHTNRADGTLNPKPSQRKGSSSRIRLQFQCQFCKNEFNFSSAMKRRVVLKSGVKVWTCKGCKEKHNLTSHAYQKPIDLDRPHQCKICHKAFLQRSTLVFHVRSHTGERPFQCQICNRSFARVDYLKAHMKIHSDEEYSCSICSLKFREKRLLRFHLRNSHSNTDVESKSSE